MATHTPIAPLRAANPITLAAADVLGDDFVSTGKELILVEHTNGAGSSVTLTVTTTATIDGEAVADKLIAIGPGETHVLGPWPQQWYNDANAKVTLSWSAVTDITLAVIKPS